MNCVQNFDLIVCIFIQTWINSISHGPNGRSLIANYQNSEVHTCTYYKYAKMAGTCMFIVCLHSVKQIAWILRLKSE